MLLPMLSNRFATPTLTDPVFTLRREIDRLFDAAWSGNGHTGSATWAPPMDVIERNGEVRCVLELPGLRPEDVSITTENGVLTITGEKRREHNTKESDGTYVLERRYGRFERSLILPDTVDRDKITANFENGVLTIVLPRTAEAKPRRIEIRSGENGKRIESQKA